MELTTEPAKKMLQSKLNITLVYIEIRKGMWMESKYIAFCSIKL